MFTLILIDPKEELYLAWKEAFSNFPEVEIRHGYFEEVEEFDCMVSAANSFGLMDGGVDLAIINHFGAEVEEKVQRVIIDEYYGEQSVVTSFIIPVGNPRNQYIAHTPTMRVPKPIIGTDNVYKAMKAMLEAVDRFNKADSSGAPLQRILCPGFGTSTGRMPVKEAARQMAVAYKGFVTPIRTINWQIAQNRHFDVSFGWKGMR